MINCRLKKKAQNMDFPLIVDMWKILRPTSQLYPVDQTLASRVLLAIYMVSSIITQLPESFFRFAIFGQIRNFLEI